TDFSIQAAPATVTHLLDAGFASQLQSAMQSQNASVYLRIPFNVEAGAVFHHLTLRVRYEDGFVAYLNGFEVARRNAPDAPAWNSAATMNRGKGQALEFETIDLGGAMTNLVTGANMLAVHGLNDTAASADFLFQAELIARTDRPIALTDSRTVKARVQLDGAWSALNEATFNSRVPLRLTEIMYNPPGEGVVSGDEFEFIELQNVGHAALNLSGFTF